MHLEPILTLQFITSSEPWRPEDSYSQEASLENPIDDNIMDQENKGILSTNPMALTAPRWAFTPPQPCKEDIGDDPPKEPSSFISASNLPSERATSTSALGPTPEDSISPKNTILQASCVVTDF